MTKITLIHSAFQFPIPSAPIFGIDKNFNVNVWNVKAAEITQFTKEEVMGHNLVNGKCCCCTVVFTVVFSIVFGIVFGIVFSIVFHPLLFLRIIRKDCAKRNFFLANTHHIWSSHCSIQNSLLLNFVTRCKKSLILLFPGKKNLTLNSH